MFNRTFWKGRRVLLTGHTGFKGSWLSLWLDALGAEVTGYALDPPTSPSLYEQAGICGIVRSIHGDILDYVKLASVLENSRPQVIIHMAAQSVVRRGYEDPVETYSTNVMGAVHLLEAVRKLGRPCIVVNVTSDKCYASRDSGPGYHEDEPMGGHDPYSNSKGCAELVSMAYRHSFFPVPSLARHGVAIASARAGNAIGGGDWTQDQLIPDLIKAFLAGEACLIRNPSAIRPWQFVLEPLRGYLMLAERLAEDGVRFSSPWNFGPANSDALPVSRIADEMVRRWGGTASWKSDGASHPPEAQFLKLDVSKAHTYLDWHPVLPLKQSLGWIVEWYHAFKAGADLLQLTRDQIARYEGLLLE